MFFNLLRFFRRRRRTVEDSMYGDLCTARRSLDSAERENEKLTAENERVLRENQRLLKENARLRQLLDHGKADAVQESSEPEPKPMAKIGPVENQFDGSSDKTELIPGLCEMITIAPAAEKDDEEYDTIIEANGTVRSVTEKEQPKSTVSPIFKDAGKPTPSEFNPDLISSTP